MATAEFLSGLLTAKHWLVMWEGESMSALANIGWESRGDANVEATPIPEGPKETALWERMLILRDTFLVLGLQLVFRATAVMRRWNY
jgi:hypothetical protein